MDSTTRDPVGDRLLLNITLVAGPHNETRPSQEYGECVPQREYAIGTGNSPSANVKDGLEPFLREDGTHLPVRKALDKDYAGLVRRDMPALTSTGQTVNVRIEWPGYESREYQLRTIDWRKPPQKIRVSKLATEVAKIVEKFIQEMQGKPINPEEARWQVGLGGVQVEHLHLASFEQASQGSWQVRVFYKPLD